MASLLAGSAAAVVGEGMAVPLLAGSARGRGCTVEGERRSRVLVCRRGGEVGRRAALWEGKPAVASPTGGEATLPGGGDSGRRTAWGRGCQLPCCLEERRLAAWRRGGHVAWTPTAAPPGVGEGAGVSGSWRRREWARVQLASKILYRARMILAVASHLTQPMSDWLRAVETWAVQTRGWAGLCFLGTGHKAAHR